MHLVIESVLDLGHLWEAERTPKLCVPGGAGPLKKRVFRRGERLGDWRWLQELTIIAGRGFRPVSEHIPHEIQD